MARIVWTAQEESILRKMAQAKRTVREVCFVLKSRSPASITAKALKMGLELSYSPSPEIDEAAFKRLMGGR